MSIFDKLKQAAPVAGAPQNRPGGKATFVFPALPESLAQMQAMPEATLQKPEHTAALTVAALCVYPIDKEAALKLVQNIFGSMNIDMRKDLAGISGDAVRRKAKD